MVDKITIAKEGDWYVTGRGWIWSGQRAGCSELRLKIARGSTSNLWCG